jgi:cytochrome c oxidase accessory protein FixG
MNDALLKPEEQVLSTLRGDGTRRWLKPKLSRGTFLFWRRVVAYFLILLFTALPFIKIAGKPAILLDIPARRFTIFGYTFLPTDTLFLALFMVGVVLTIFLITALFGRVWCGWACPQTVYMEFLFRPIERFFDGTSGRGGEPRKERPPWLKALKYPFYILACFYLANTFLAYFVGVETLMQWVQQSPLKHPAPFLIMGFVTVAMMLDFGFFREQVCIIMCPYGRFQSVLLDKASLIVSYDSARGEPRGKLKKKGGELPVLGDCIDCGNCVTTCPTGIDIRQGLQMECIGCTQCIDACNTVMAKLNRPPDLIRYSNQMRDQGASTSLFRPRVVLYPLLLLLIASLFGYLMLNKLTFNATLLRPRGNPFTLVEENQVVRNMIQVKLVNRTENEMAFNFSVIEPTGATLSVKEPEVKLSSEEMATFNLEILAPRSVFRAGRSPLKIKAENESGEAMILKMDLAGPFN